MKAIRVYADTSVFGGILDEEFSEASRLFFEQTKLYNAVNVLNGFSEIAIFSPLEVISYEK